MNRSEYYGAITKELIGKDVPAVKRWMRVKFRTEIYQRLDLNELEELLDYLKAIKCFVPTK